MQFLVQSVQRINFQHIASQNLAHGGELFFQAGNLAGVVALYFLELSQQPLRLQLFFGQLCDDGVVVDSRLHLAILVSKLLVLVFHLLLVERSQFAHVLIRIPFPLEADTKECNRPDEQHTKNP